MAPVIDSTKTIGIVFLPGAMTVQMIPLWKWLAS